ncbi:DUF5304 family protein [Streptomyces sp. ST2-7A]|uniref:DUF5304 family protein n=1 Tax=Streptomyces sp. ST2-7A TaxID=2907214 RepID=UPI001F298026|nr:DUF5304 family protein [Streptomyces sp. ST2-7A]MCE7083303.1 DUF5304 domain-containing protein [Streptomyces sp. ST2-7A]
MSDAHGADRPEAGPPPGTPSPGSPDAWAAACAEDLARERARHRARSGPLPGEGAEQMKRIADLFTDGLSRFGGDAARVARGARFALDPVIERNGPALDHLARAGGELAAALRGFLDPGPSVNTPPRADDTRPTGPGTGTEPAPDAPGAGRGTGEDGDPPPPEAGRPDDQG